MTAVAVDGSNDRPERSFLRYAPFHGLRWLVLIVVYALLFSWIVATLGAWQFQDRLRAQARGAPEAYQLRMDLLRAGGVFDDRVGALVNRLVQFPERSKPDLEQLQLLLAKAKGLSAAADGTTAMAAANPDAELVGRMAALLADEASSLLSGAGQLQGDFATGLEILKLAPVKLEQPAPPGLLVEVTTAQQMELGFFRLAGLGFAEPPMRRLVTWPDGHLTILLTLLMGMLGSTLYTTRFMLDYAIKGYRLDEPPPYPASWFVFRPLFGAATALAIYVLFRAGQLSFTATTGSDGDSLNPFIIAFMAIIAGLMSWQALKFIEIRGERWLSGQDRQVLWASGLARALADRGKPVRELAVQVGRTPRQVERWLRYRDRVTPEMQDRIAGLLEAAPEQLFGRELPPGRGEPAPAKARDLAEALKTAGRTPAQLAYHLQVDVTTVEEWAAGKRQVSPLEQEMIADLVDRPVDELFEPGQPITEPAAKPPVAAPATTPLLQAIQAAGMSALQLAEGLTAAGQQVTDAEVEGWAQGTRVVPEGLRPTVAGLLGVDPATIGWG